MPEGKVLMVVLDVEAPHEAGAKSFGFSRLEQFIRINQVEHFHLMTVTEVD